MSAASHRAARRIQKEAEAFDTEVDRSFVIESQTTNEWIIAFIQLESTIYAGEVHRIRVRFPDNYPLESPEVVFLLPSPVHPHIYSNGHICLNILYADWTPALTVKSVCYSLLSMLASCKEKCYPSDNKSYTSVTRGSPKNTNFIFHDDAV